MGGSGNLYRSPISPAEQPIADSPARAHEVLAGFVIGEDHHRPAKTGEPVERVDGAGGEDSVEEWHVAQQQGEDSLGQETKVHEAVAHTLLQDRKLTGLGDEQIGPLHDNNGDEVGGLGRGQHIELDVVVAPELQLAVPPVNVTRGCHSSGPGRAGDKLTTLKTIRLGVGLAFAVYCKLVGINRRIQEVGFRLGLVLVFLHVRNWVGGVLFIEVKQGLRNGLPLECHLVDGLVPTTGAAANSDFSPACSAVVVPSLDNQVAVT